MAIKLKITSPLMKGEAVKQLQSALNALGYSCGEAESLIRIEKNGVHCKSSAH